MGTTYVAAYHTDAGNYSVSQPSTMADTTTDDKAPAQAQGSAPAEPQPAQGA